MLVRDNPDRIRIAFDDHRLVANADLLLPATLARHLGLRELVDHHFDLGGATGRANTGDKLLTLVASELVVGDFIYDADARRSDSLRSRQRSQGAIHPGHIPAQHPLGPRPPTQPGEPPVAGSGLTATLNSDGEQTPELYDGRTLRRGNGQSPRPWNGQTPRREDRREPRRSKCEGRLWSRQSGGVPERN